MEESGRHYVGQKTEEITKRKSVGNLRGTSLYIRVGNTGTDRETGGEDTDSRNKLGPKNIESNSRRQKEDEGIERRDWHEKHLKMKVAGSRMRWAGTNGQKWKTTAEYNGRWRELTTKVFQEILSHDQSQTIMKMRRYLFKSEFASGA